MYPSANFVLSLRRDEERWPRSIEVHTTRRRWIGHRDIYGCCQAGQCRGSYLETYRRHSQSVVDFFACRDESHRLLLFVIDGPRSHKSTGGHGLNESGSPPVDPKWKILVDF